MTRLLPVNKLLFSIGMAFTIGFIPSSAHALNRIVLASFSRSDKAFTHADLITRSHPIELGGIPWAYWSLPIGISFLVGAWYLTLCTRRYLKKRTKP